MWTRSSRASLAPLFLATVVGAQIASITPQNSSWNSSFQLPSAEISTYNLSSVEASNLDVGVQFERTNWAFGSVAQDSIYRAPPLNSSTPAGTLLKIEQVTNASYYNLPPQVALSRFTFVTKTLNGTTIPASAYVLWPYLAKKFSNCTGVPLVAWAHGTSGVFGECAPSHIRNLWYQFSAPFTLALSGYAVVAPDFAGLGVNQTAEGEPVIHPYLANPAHANDLIYATQAAQSGWKELSRQFVVMGHSQGGGAAWAAAQRQAVEPVDGYLGTVAGSPATSVRAIATVNVGKFSSAFYMARGVKSVFPAFNISSIFTADGYKRALVETEVQGCASANAELWDNSSLVNAGWYDNEYFQKYNELTYNGNKTIGGPMLIVHGTADRTNPFPIVEGVFNSTCALLPKNQIELAVFQGATHVPALFAGQQVWLEWIAERFEGKPAKKGCVRSPHSPVRNTSDYQVELQYYLQLATQSYLVA